MATKETHVMMLPWLAFGHIIPYLELAKKLAEKGIKISFVSTPKNLDRLPPVPPNLADKINLIGIPLESIDGLPQNCEATIDVQPDQIQYLKKAFDRLATPFEQFLSKNLPDVILGDFSSYWLPELAAKFRVPAAYFSVYTAATLCFMGPPNELLLSRHRKTPDDFTVPPNWIDFPSLVSHRPDYAPTMLRNLVVPDASGKSSGERLAAVIQGSPFVAIRSCNEFEGEYIELLGKLYQRPIIPVGVLPPAVEKAEDSTGPTWSTAFQWLNKQNPKSVLFVGFGSEYKMPINQIHELAHGIELSNQKFIWILRKPKGGEGIIPNLLPLGLEDRTRNNGMIVLDWAPQAKILSHRSIGGCLFHSGWGSIVESLGSGLPLILMPMVADQGLNAKLLVEKGLGVEVPRNEDGSFGREEVARAVRMVMESEEGKTLREKADRMKSVFGSASLHESYVSSFVKHVQKTF